MGRILHATEVSCAVPAAAPGADITPHQVSWASVQVKLLPAYLPPLHVPVISNPACMSACSTLCAGSQDMADTAPSAAAAASCGGPAYMCPVRTSSGRAQKRSMLGSIVRRMAHARPAARCALQAGG